MYCIDATEGRRDDEGGRRWEVSVARAAEVQREAQVEAELRKEIEQQSKLEGEIARILKAMKSTPEGDTKSAIRERSGITTKRFEAAFGTMLDRGVVANCEIRKGNQRTPRTGFKLVDQRPTRAVGQEQSDRLSDW